MPQDIITPITTYGTAELLLPRRNDLPDTPDQEGRVVGPTASRFSSYRAKKAPLARLATAALVAFVMAFLGSIRRVGPWEAFDEGVDRKRQADITPFAMLRLGAAPSPLKPDQVHQHDLDDHQGRHRSILLLRHAKSSWDNPANTTDKLRPLAPEGEDVARRMGVFLHTNAVEPPDLIVSSPSLRTRSTLSLVLERWMPDAERREAVLVRYDQQLYDLAFSGSGYFEYLLGLDPTYQRIMLVGHNPAIRSLALQLVSPDNNNRFKLPPWRRRRKLPPGSFAEIRGKGSWNTWEEGEGKLVMFVPPKQTLSSRVEAT